jgi:hypothetical protein
MRTYKATVLYRLQKIKEEQVPANNIEELQGYFEDSLYLREITHEKI